MNEAYLPQASPAKKSVDYGKIMFIPFAAGALVWLLNLIVTIIQMVHYTKEAYNSYSYYHSSRSEIFFDYLSRELPYLFECFVFMVVLGILAIFALRKHRGVAYPILYGVLALAGLIDVILDLVQVIRYAHWYNVVRLLITLLVLMGYIGVLVFSLLLQRKHATVSGRETVRKISILPPILLAGCWALYMLFRIIAMIQWHDGLNFFSLFYFLFGDLTVLLTAAGVFMVNKWLSQAAPAAPASVPPQFVRPTYVQPQYVQPQYVQPQFAPTQPLPPQFAPTQPLPVNPATPQSAQSPQP